MQNVYYNQSLLRGVNLGPVASMGRVRLKDPEQRAILIAKIARRFCKVYVL